MKQAIVHCLLLGFLLALAAGCRENKAGIIQYRLGRCDYTEKIIAPGTIQAVNSLYIKSQIGFSTVSYLAEEGEYVKKRDTVCILDHPELINNLETTILRHEELLAELKKLEADNAMKLSMLEAQMDNNEIQVAINSLDSVQKKFAPPVQQRLMELELEKVKVEKSKLQKKYAAQKRISETELRGMSSRIMQMENRIQRMQDEVDKLTVLAPGDGMVMHTEAPELYFSSMSGSGKLGGKIEEGSTVYTDMPILEMPDMKEMQVSVEVAEGDFKRIEPGQKALIRVDAADKLLLTGSVNRKMPVGKDASRDLKLKTYEVVLSIDSCHSLLTPGLSAVCDIIVHEVKDTVVIPTIAIHERDSSRFVYVAQKGKFLPVDVETGLSNSSQSIVSKGLKGDETIALSEPPFRHLLRNSLDENIPDSTGDTAGEDPILNDAPYK